MRGFWELESIPQSEMRSNGDAACDDFYDNTVKRDSSGRYTVKLPFKENCNLGNSKEGALKRFFALEGKLQSNENLKRNYIKFMDEYRSLGHMTPLTSDSKSQNYFLPHHGVINENSSTTKLRVVFDGSFKTDNGKSLNDVLMKGKKLQTDIFAILMRFRTFPVAFSADITKMYRQILVASEDTKFQQIFWRNSANDPLLIYTLNTVTYGTACAPYLAIRTIKQLCLDEGERFPSAANLAQEHFYVDDLLAGAESVESAKLIIQELLKFMSSGGFELRKWTCSHPEVIAQMPGDLKAGTFSHSFQEGPSQNILGLSWDLSMDAFKVKSVLAENVTTKRHLLSIIARTFDPLGFIAPSTIILKIILQDLWKAKLGWDEQVPADILDRWNKFQAEIHFLKEISVPRYIHSVDSLKVEVHGFCDAALKAYAAVIYVRVVSNSCYISLMAAKTRVAPLQSVTLPRLELCGALLLAELVDAFKRAIHCPIHETYLWCDSTITLSWINNPPVSGNQFVQHRVSKIHSLTEMTSWRHIPGKLNPADCATRGLYPKQLLECPEWLRGPNWLYDFDPLSTETTVPDKPSDIDLTIQSNPSADIKSFVTQVNPVLDLLEKYSSYMKLIRTVSWIFRFYNNSKLGSKTTGPLRAAEIDTAIKIIVKLLQNSAFSSEITQIKSNRSFSKTSKLISLNPFFDDEGVLRVGGRLRHQQNLSFDQKFPMLLPKHHHFTMLLIKYYHCANLHAGQEVVLSLIRQKFWIPDGKSAVRKELRKCMECFKLSAKPISQIMGDLPSSRINPCRVFEKVGIDFAGPISTKCQHARKSSTFKSYICLFICMCTKAVHLEVVSTLATSAFLAAFRRFVARRGYPSDVFSDNGTNFVGASAYLKSLFAMIRDSRIQDYASQRNIRWHFIPPYAPNFGGVWEASIKLTKNHLIRTCKAALLNFEELVTLLCQIESCINSRPLYPLSTDIEDFQALTPGHFLIGCPLLELPEHNTNKISLSFNSRWSLLLKLKEEFWKKWITSYLHTLQPRTKWWQRSNLLKPGIMVVLKDPVLHANRWTLGRIVSTHLGADGLCRVVTVRTAKGLSKRPVSQIAVLPLQDADETSRAPGSMLEKDN